MPTERWETGALLFPDTIDFADLERRVLEDEARELEAFRIIDMATEQGRATLLYNAGRASVLKDFEDERDARLNREP